MRIIKALSFTILSFILSSIIIILIILPVTYFINDGSIAINHLKQISIIVGSLLSYILIFYFFWKPKLNIKKAISPNNYNYKIVFFLILIAIGNEYLKMPFNHFERIINYSSQIKALGYGYLYYEFNTFRFYQIISAILIALIFEELFFRKFLLSKLLEKHNKSIALVTSSLCFSIIHFETLNNLIPAFIFGIISGLIFIKTRKIGYSILLHLMINSIWLILFLFGKTYDDWIFQLKFNLLYWTLFIFGIGITFYGVNKTTTANNTYK